MKSNIAHQLEFLFSLKTGSFPLYVPGFAGGHSSSALTMGQIFHPISRIASIMPGYWEGKAIEWITLLKLLSIGFTQLVLFRFLSELRLNTFYSFLLSFITVYNLKLVDMFRHGASLEAYTGHFIICAIIGWYFIRPTKWTGPLLIIASTWLMVMGGHVEEIYYGMIAAVFFTIVAPFFLSAMLPEKKVDLRTACTFWLIVGSCITLGIALSSFFILPFYFEFISVNVDRVNKSYVYATRSLDTFIGTVNNFFLPLRADLNTAFGGTSFILITALLPVLRIFKIKIPRSVWIIWGMLLFVFLHIQGDRTPVHKIVWQYFPLASSIRVPGRISIIMPFFMMLVLAWIIKAEPESGNQKRSFASLKPLTIIAYIASFFLMTYYLVYFLGYYVLELPSFKILFPPYFVDNFRGIPFWGIELSVFAFSLASILVLAFYSRRNTSNRLLRLCLLVVIIMQTGIILKYRAMNWVEKKYDSPTFTEMKLQKKAKLNYMYYPITGFYPSYFKKQLTNSFIEPFLGKIFTRVIPVSSSDEAYSRMQKDRLPQQVFIEGYDTEKANQVTENAKDMNKGEVTLVYSSFNRVNFQVSSEAPAIFGLSYPYSGHWQAWVNGEKSVVYRANGAAHAVDIPAGESIVEFRYWSNAYFWGVIISCTTFALIGTFVCYRTMKKSAMVIGIIVFIVAGAGVFMIWYDSLYSGDNLNYEYAWNYAPPLKALNIAYGKKNWLGASATASPLALHDRDLELYSGMLVDGDKSPASGFTTRLCDYPSWVLDLHRDQKIKTILLYESPPFPTMSSGPVDMLEFFSQYYANHPVLLKQNSSVNLRPLEIALSNDGSKWRIISSVFSLLQHDGPLNIVIDKPQAARFIRITASGKSKLSFNEIEVYGPDAERVLQ